MAARLLLESGADKNLVDFAGQTAVHIAEDPIASGNS